MPLKQPDNVGDLWTWMQAVAWIGFDVETAPLDWVIYEKELAASTGKNRTEARQVEMAAIDELLTAVAEGHLAPVWRGSHSGPQYGNLDIEGAFAEPGHQDNTKATMLKRLQGIVNLSGCPFTRLHFGRDDVLAHWPPDAPRQRAARVDYGSATSKLDALASNLGVEKVMDMSDRALAERVFNLMRNDASIDNTKIPGDTKMREHVKGWKEGRRNPE